MVRVDNVLIRLCNLTQEMFSPESWLAAGRSGNKNPAARDQEDGAHLRGFVLGAL